MTSIKSPVTTKDDENSSNDDASNKKLIGKPLPKPASIKESSHPKDSSEKEEEKPQLYGEIRKMGTPTPATPNSHEETIITSKLAAHTITIGNHQYVPATPSMDQHDTSPPSYWEPFHSPAPKPLQGMH